MGFADTGAGAGAWIGAEKGREATQFDLDIIWKLIQEQEAAAKGLDPSQVGRTDPALRAAQMKALAQMMGVADAGGMDPQSMAAEAQGNRAAADQEKAQRGAIVQDAQARGVGGGGAELAAQLQAQQAGANRSAMVGQQAAADARTRALQAMSNYASLASGVRGQDYQGQQMGWDAGMQKYGAQKDARQAHVNFQAADRADNINRLASGGKAVGGLTGGGLDTIFSMGASNMMGGVGGGKPAANMTGDDYDYFNNLYGKP